MLLEYEAREDREERHVRAARTLYGQLGLWAEQRVAARLGIEDHRVQGGLRIVSRW